MSTARARLMRRTRRYLAIWMTNIGLDNDQGLTDINSDAEDFCCGLLNIVLEARLQNLNLLQMNFPAIDLADKDRRICVQVTSTAGAEKITHTLDRFFAHHLDEDYDRLIVMILGKKKKYQKQFPQKEGFSFDHTQDVWDIQKLLTQIAGLTMPMLEQVDDYLREQFGDLEEQAPSMDLPVLSALDDNTFLGRDDELAEIARRFEQNEKLAILSGLGGMGKTELAVRFALTRWGGESYFVHFTKNWRQTVLENIAPRIRGLNRDGADADRIYRDAMAELKSHGADELLIIDNVDQEEDSLTQLKRELSELRLRILITTRTDTAHKISVAQLQYEELDRLFELHESDVSPEEQRQLIDAVDGHTLTVDLMARALRPRLGAATADKLLNNLSDRTIRGVETAYPGAPGQARIIEHLKKVFRVVALKEEEQALLQYATLLPDGGMQYPLFLADHEEDWLDPLTRLTDNGWLNFKDELLSIHPVIRKVCVEELKPSDENCGDYLNGFSAQYDEKDYRLERLRQMAELLTKAADHLADTQGTWALIAGERWRDVGDFTQAQKYSICAMRKLEQDPASNEPALAQAYNNVGCTYGDLGDHRKALDYQKKALAIRETVLPKDHSDLARSYNNVGGAYRKLGDHRKALDYQKKALAIFEKALPEDHPDLATSYNNVGSTYGDLGDQQKALDYKKKALAIREKVLPKDHPHLAASYNNVGSTYSALGDHRKALDYLKKALAIREKALPEDHPDLAASYNNVGFTYGYLGDHQKALDYQKKALAIREKVLPPDHPDLALSYNNVGGTYYDLGNSQKALEYQKRALAIQEKVLPTDHSDLATSYNNVGGTYYNLGNYQKALEYQKKALAIWEKVLPANHPDLALSCCNVAWDYHKIGQYQEAAQYMRRAADIISRSSLPEEHPKQVDYPNLADRFEKDAKMQQMLLAQAPQFGTPPFLFPKK